MRLGQAKHAEHVALRQGREPLFFLSQIAIAHQNGIDRAVGHADGCTGAPVARRDFFNDHSQCQVVEVGPTKLFGNANAVSAQFSQAFVYFFGKVMLFVPPRGMRPKLLRCKATDCLAYQLLVLIKDQSGLLANI